MQKLVVLTGAGVSAESGLKTFRDAGGLWEGHDVMDVASIDGWHRNPALVLDFYNQRRQQALQAKPNRGHQLIAELEKYFEVIVITQNVDNLHEKAGSSAVIHLHGELFKCRSVADDKLIYDMDGWQLNQGDLCEKGAQLRPHIVWFGEAVPLLDRAICEVASADLIIIVGTSLKVYPAASLIQYAPDNIQKYIIDPNMPNVTHISNVHCFEKRGSEGMKAVYELLTSSSK